MAPREELIELYVQWRQWTDIETEAIGASAWQRVDQCQAAKLDLQPRIVRATEQLQNEAGGLRSQLDANDSFFRPVINELIELERRNLELIARQREDTEREREGLDRTTRNLRQIHRTYASDRSHAAHWQSYS